MNRRDFFKLAGMGLLGLVFPKSVQTQIGDNMELGSLLVKVAKNESLSPQEIDFLKRTGDETQQRNSFVAGNTTPQNTLSVPSPFFPIFSEVLQTDTASITINIPTGFTHLLIFNSMRSTDAGTTNRAVAAEINGDTGNNYDYQALYSYSATVTGSAGIAVPFLNIGTIIPNGQGANIYGSAYTFIANYLGSQYKTSQTLSYFNVHTLNPATNISSCIWYNTAPIQSIRVYGHTVAAMKAGSALSVYGLI